MAVQILSEVALGCPQSFTKGPMKKLLFIEDDAFVGRMYQRGLQSEGFQVDLVGDGEAGLAAFRRKKPDVVLLDLMLPKVSGLRILQHIRAQPETTSCPSSC